MASPIKIVRLDGMYAPPPTFTLPHTYTEYPLTPDHSTIPSRIGDADVVLTTRSRVPITAETLDQCPNLKLVAALAIGTDMVDLEACRARKVQVCNVPAASNESVAEHAIALFFAVRRNVVNMHEMTVEGSLWKKNGALVSTWGGMPGTCKEEVMGILGAGELGNRVANIGRALGMSVLLAERKGVPESSVREGRTSFEETIKRSTIIMITVPLTPETRSLISTPEFAVMRTDAVVINVARGGIVDEEALVEALRQKRIGGAATDVYTKEPAGKDNALVLHADEEGIKGRLILSPHLAWYARSSIEKLQRVMGENVDSWAKGKPLNIVV